MQIKESRSFVQAFQVLPMLRSLNELYPGFESWYVNTVVPGVVLGNDKLLLAKDGDQVVGVALGKHTPEETKLRCVRVLPSHQGSGVGLKLIDRMIETLGCRLPHCSVAEEMLHVYSRAFLHRYGFVLTAVDKGSYRRGKLEYRFN